jgi:hypothetical protein
MNLNRYPFFKKISLAAFCMLLTACATVKNQGTPYISLHPVRSVNNLQVALQITSPTRPTQYINANAVLSNSNTTFASDAAAAINNYQNPPSSLSNSSSSSSSSSSTPGVTTGTYSLPPMISTPLGSNVPQPVAAQPQTGQATTSTQTTSSAVSKEAAELQAAKIQAIATLRPEIENILTQYGFVPVIYQPQLQRKLTVQIVSLTNTSGLQMTIEIDAINGMLTYSQTYTGSSSDLSIGSLNDRTVRLFGDLMTKALADSQLISFLNQP